MRRLFLLFLLLLVPGIALAQQQHIAPTEAKTPEEEKKTFTVPKGFEAQLVAAEPDIGKPIQISFDDKGRLWVTTSRHYPFAADSDKASDKLYILSDFDKNGKAAKVSVFYDKLNIPIGILPLPGSKSCIVSSVGEVLLLTDTDGDGKADVREVLYTGWGTRDTHGMYNSFTAMPDGWIYGCHGFSNESHVRGAVGPVIHMQSGHTFRFKLPTREKPANSDTPIGGPIEIFTRGQVNPFGMTSDPWGNLYTADCHSKPITQLIRGAYYDSFGKPSDGLGFAPHVTRHDHGSTALCGLAWCESKQFPPEYRGCMYLGNVVTCRVNADRIVWKGSTPVAEERPDFVKSTDPWFRPTDIKMGPDGAMYIADFYNRIIGHYEVDLKHPLRDRDRGRIWRVVYHGDQPVPGSTAEKANPEWPQRLLAEKTTLNDQERLGLHQALNGSPRQARVAVDVLTVHGNSSSIKPLLQLVEKLDPEDTHLRHALKIALRNSLINDKESKEILLTLASKATPDTLFLDEVLFGVHTPLAGSWYAARLKKVRDFDRVAEHVARYGENHHRDKVWDEIATTTDLTAHLNRLKAFKAGLQAAGAKYNTSIPKEIQTKVVQAIDSTYENERRVSLQIAGLYNYDLSDKAMAIILDAKASTPSRTTALTYLSGKGSGAKLVTACVTLTKDSNAPQALREQAAAVIGAAPGRRKQAAEMMKDLPYKTTVALATGMASSLEGANLLFDTVKLGHASPRLLQERAILDRLKLAKVPDYENRVKTLTAGLPSVDLQLVALIRKRSDSFRMAKIDVTEGKKLYTTHCAACHQIGGQGGKVGPNLDGVGIRGVERLGEDILDPNRNVDAAFRSTLLELKDGKTLSGLVLRQEGKVVIMADVMGKEVRIAEDDIEKRVLSALSPMPGDWGEKLKPEEYHQILGYLLEQKAKP